MKILDTVPVFKTRFLSLLCRRFTTKSGKEGKWYFASRHESPPFHKDKKPDAVIIAAVWTSPEGEKRLALTDEFRVPIGARELGFPAGLIDAGETIEVAAIREFKEETGLDLEITEVSPPNLYSSAGMTNESIVIVFGKATGTPSCEQHEDTEDIQVLLADEKTVAKYVKGEHNIAIGAKAWPIMWAMLRTGELR